MPDEKAEKAARGKKKKEKTYTLTREQMEAAELAARQLESVKDQFVRLTAEYDNYRKRTLKEKMDLVQTWRCTTTWSGLWPLRAMRTLPTRRGWR